MISEHIIGRDPWSMQLLNVTVRNGIITQVSRRDDPHAHALFLTPGLVDLQVNGFARHDVNAVAPDPDQIHAITVALRRHGVTTWVPTVVTGTEQEIISRIDAVTKAIATDIDVASAVPFIHVEGPFISDHDGPRGVHDRTKVRPIDVAEVKRWAKHGRVGYVTISPHAADAPEKIAAIVAQHIAVALGHTHASHSQLTAAVDAGASLSTHLGNGIALQLSRHPNAIWTQLADSRLQCALIADGHHLPSSVFSAMVAALGPSRAYVVSDAVELAGAEPGSYKTPVGKRVDVRTDGRLTDPDSGLLAGSGASLGDCFSWIVTQTRFSISRAVELASVVPGRIVSRLCDCDGFASRGVMRIGGRADICQISGDGEIVDVVAGTWRRERQE